jgi:serine/threonine-protein kinase HipA
LVSPAYDLNPNVANVLIAVTWLRSAEISTRFSQITSLAEIGAIAPRAAKSIYEEVEAATLGGWRTTASYAGVPDKIAAIWEKETVQQTKLLREDARRTASSSKVRSQAPKRRAKS